MAYLDDTLNLSDGLYKPFHKPKSEINYIHKESNLSPSIIKLRAWSVESWLSKSIFDENVFIQAAPVNQEALKQVGYKYKLSHNNTDKYTSNNINDIILT